MKIRKPNNFIPYKKYPDKYFDWDTDEEFTYEEINHYPRWYKYEYDNNGNKIYRETSNGYWIKREYDNNGNKIYYENSDGDWQKWEYDADGNIMYYENNDGLIVDTRI